MDYSNKRGYIRTKKREEEKEKFMELLNNNIILIYGE